MNNSSDTSLNCKMDANQKIVKTKKSKDKVKKVKDICYKTEEIAAIVDYTHVITINQEKNIDNILFRMNEDLQTQRKMVQNLRIGLKKAKNKRYYKVVCAVILFIVFFISVKFLYNIIF